MIPSARAEKRRKTSESEFCGNFLAKKFAVEN